MSTQPLYCHNCKKTYNVRQEDLNLMKKYSGDFNKNGYIGGCFFKNIGKLKRLLNQKGIDDRRCECK